MSQGRVRRRVASVLASLSLAGAALLGVTAGSAPASAATASTGSAPSPIQYTTSTQPLQALGRVNFTAIPGASKSAASHAAPASSHRSGVATRRLGRLSRTGPAVKTRIPRGKFGLHRGKVAGVIGFPGVTSPESAAVNIPPAVTPTFSDVEPPDQATCAGPDAFGRPIVFDFVNDAVAAYSTTGHQELGVKPAYAMFDQPASAFMSDPRCYYDAPTHRWFFTMFDVGSPAPSTQFIAVSTSADPLGSYEVFAFDTTDTNNPLGDCPCFGDFDQIGADANGFYISTNEFSNVGKAPGYNGADIWAFPKWGLVAAASGFGPVPSIIRYAVTSDAFGASTPSAGDGPYHLAPAATPPGGAYAPDTEYFVESNSELNADDHLIVYALHGTGLLASGGTPTLSATELTSEAYAFPPNATQKAGPLPLGSTFGVTTPPTIEADFNAVQQTTYTDGELYGELDTAVGATSSSPGVDGIDWFALAPRSTGRGVSASIVKQGYVSNSQNLLYPDLVLDGSGHGDLVFSMSGSAEYPSAAYVAFHSQPTGPIQVAAAGAAPEDGFTCYPPFGTPASGCRWGDYSDGAVWGGRAYMMAEYIPPTPRDTESNWGTFAWSVPVH